MTEIIPDRPWETREYGRLRLNEIFAKELQELLLRELDSLHDERGRHKADDVPVTSLNRKIRRINAVSRLLHGMMHEKGWCECD